jgi:hypothetical protein
MSKFANTFLNTLKEETEGNAFTAKLAKTKKGGEFEINGKKIKDTSNYDDAAVKENKKGHKKEHKKAAKSMMKEQVEGEAEGDEATWKASLDKTTKPEDFDTEDNPRLGVDASGVDAARSWVSKLEEMADFVNGTGPESLNSKINELEVKNSIPFRGVVRREEKRITKLAENLRGLAEVFKSVIINSPKKIKDATER